MTDTKLIPHPRPLDDRGIFITDLLDDKDRVERENLELRCDRESLRVTLQASLDLIHKYHTEILKLRARVRQLQPTPERRAA